jgi:hypothetical protein
MEEKGDEPLFLFIASSHVAAGEDKIICFDGRRRCHPAKGLAKTELILDQAIKALAFQIMKRKLT